MNIRGHPIESLWHPLNLENGWSSSVMGLTYQLDLDKYGEREGRDKTREGQERREEDCELRVREGGEKQRKK